MSAIRGASATLSRSGDWERGWDSVAAPPDGRVAMSSADAAGDVLDSSTMVADAGGCLVTKARLDAAARETRGVDGRDADADDGTEVAATAARRREMFNLIGRWMMVH